MKLILPLFVSLAVAAASPAFAQENEGAAKTEKGKKPPATAPANNGMVRDSPSGVVAAFFGSLEKGEVDQAYDSLTKGSKIAEKPEELRQLKAKTREAIEIFGSVLGYDLVDTKLVGTRLARSTYVSLGKVFPLRWRFYFYRSEEAWRLIDMRVDDKLAGIFEETEDPKVPEPHS